MSERIVHLCSSDATADALSLAELPGDLRVWADALDQGPLLPVDDAAFRDARAGFWAERGHGDVAAARARLDGYDRAADELAGCDELILWFEPDLVSQLALIRILSRLARRGLPPTLTMVSIDRHPEVPDFAGLAHLAPAQLAALWPARTPLSRDAVDEAITAWIAITAADPRALPFLTRRVKALPFLAGALERHLEDYPDPTSGLSRTERQVLAAIARGEASAAAIAAAIRPGDPRYPVTADGLGATLAALATAGLVTGPAGAYEITDTGRAALAGAHDRVHEAGIETWRGGVHLTGRGPAWRWDSRERRLQLR
jgi:hypothetical protein